MQNQAAFLIRLQNASPLWTGLATV